MNFLQVGDAVSATTELQLALCQDKDNKTALSLLRQIREPPEALFGPQWSEYTVQAGDTLSKIAERFLGDPLLFYGVARYNRLENPSALKVGQVIRVPTKEVPVPAAPDAPAATSVAPAPAPPADHTAPRVTASPSGGTFPGPVRVTLTASDDLDSAPVIRYTVDGSTPNGSSTVYEEPLQVDRTLTLRFLATDAAGNSSRVASEDYTVALADRYADARAWIAGGEYGKAIDALEATLAEQPAQEEARALLVAACTRYTEALVAEGRLADAQQVLERAAAADPANKSIQWRLVQIEKQAGVDQIYQNGVQASQAGELEKAYAAFQQVLELEPSHERARQKAAETKRDLVEVYSKRALAAFRRQELDEAIARWDRVLALDPDNELAKLRRAEAVDLKARFEQKFESTPVR